MTADIGDVLRVALAFVDTDYALETPTAVSVEVYAPADPETVAATYTEADAEVTLGKVFPESVRTRLARQLTQAGASTTAANLSAGTGCVELLYTPAAAGDYRFVAKATSPTTTAAQVTEFVRQTT